MALENEGSSSPRTDPIDNKSIIILILGDADIGKTSLITSYLDTINPSVQEFDIDESGYFAKHSILMDYNDIEVGVEFVDLFSGTNSVDRREWYPADVSIVLLCFSIGHYETLQSVYNLWIHEVRTHYGRLIPVFLIGLRSYMRTVELGEPEYVGDRVRENKVVEILEAELIHKKYNFQGDYLECSIENEDSIVHVLQQAVLFAMEHYNLI